MFTQFIIILSFLFFPYDALAYLSKYFAISRDITQNKNPTYKRTYVFLNILVVCKVFHMHYLSFARLSALEHAIHCDWLRLLIPKEQYNLVSTFALVMALYYNFILFWRADLKLNAILESILNEKSTSQIPFVWSTYKGRDARRIVQCLFKATWYNFQFLSLSYVGLLPFTHYRFFIQFYQNSSFFLNSSFLELFKYVVIYFLSSLGSLLTLLNYSHILAIAFTCIFTLLSIFYIKLKQSYILLTQLLGTKLTLTGFTRFHSNYIESLTFFLKTNVMYGRLFLACLFGLCPINVMLNVWTFNGLVKGNAFVAFFNVHQLMFLFVTHLIFARCTKYIHQSGDLFKLACQRQRAKGPMIDLRAKIKLDSHILAIHTKNRMGFRYGTFGLCSLGAFAKYLMLYGKFLMIGSKLLASEQM